MAPIDVALLGQRVENEVVGLPSGIMDQFISAGAMIGHASLMDCRALTLTPEPLPAGAVVAIMDTGTRRQLAEVAYGERRAACERAAAALGVPALRDAIARRGGHAHRPDRSTPRAITSSPRTRARSPPPTPWRAGDVVELGRLMSESHVSLRDDYEVSGPGLDRIVDVAAASPGCLGARMTGGGFAGCAVALVRTDEVEAFTASVLAGYEYDGHRATIWICEPAAGASVDRPGRRARATRPGGRHDDARTSLPRVRAGAPRRSRACCSTATACWSTRTPRSTSRGGCSPGVRPRLRRARRRSSSACRPATTLARHLSGDPFERAIARLEDLEVETAATTAPVRGAIDLLHAVAAATAGRSSRRRPRRLGEARWLGAALPMPRQAVAFDDVTRGKPHPEPFLAGAERLGVPAARCVVFEDSASGGDAAAAAGRVGGRGRRPTLAFHPGRPRRRPVDGVGRRGRPTGT